MEVVKWIMLFALIALCIYLVIDTTIFAVKKIKEKKKKKQQVIDEVKPQEYEEKKD